MYKPLTETSSLEFDTGIDDDEWQALYGEDLPATVFYQALRDIFSAEAQNGEDTIVLHGQVVGSQLQLHLPAVEPRDYVMVRDNEILANNLRLVIDLV